MKVLIMSDIHGNEAALRAVLKAAGNSIDKLILLGDLIDYGPHSNEVTALIKELDIPVICNIWGNHEHAIVNGEYSRFSSDRGRSSAEYTRRNLNDPSWEYIRSCMSGVGKEEFDIDGIKCLAVHGSLEDEYWKAIKPGDDLSLYEQYDYVFSGHSHLPHYFAEYYRTDRPETRNKKKTVFINPGSVGQPRNICPFAQYAVWDTSSGEITMACVPYDVKAEQACFSDEVDVFYKKRLEAGV